MVLFHHQAAFKLLHWLGLFFGNYGLAILATTVLVKTVFFPLANKSYEFDGQDEDCSSRRWKSCASASRTIAPGSSRS